MLSIDRSGKEEPINLSNNSIDKINYIIPKNSYPFDHYIVLDIIEFEDPHSWYNYVVAICKRIFYWS